MIYNIFKRFFDLIFSLMGLIILLPIFIIIAVIIKKNSKGPILYKGIRSGKFGKPFKVFKFRTMIESAEKKGGPSTALNDPRLTKVGKKFRKYKLDELPQLINILLGQMSFVGPRPQVEKYTKLYNTEEKIILSVRPGLTDYASIEFINLDKVLGDQNINNKYLEKIEPKKNQLRIKYVKNQSLWVDLKILFKTFLALFKIKSLWNTKD